jgi:hypothetical protein
VRHPAACQRGVEFLRHTQQNTTKHVRCCASSSECHCEVWKQEPRVKLDEAASCPALGMQLVMDIVCVLVQAGCCFPDTHCPVQCCHGCYIGAGQCSATTTQGSYHEALWQGNPYMLQWEIQHGIGADRCSATLMWCTNTTHHEVLHEYEGGV